jgi:hypothetical protein
MSSFQEKRRRGSSAVLSIFFVGLFSALSVSFVAMTQTNSNMSVNHRGMSNAQAAADSGLEYAQALMSGYLNDYEPSTFDGAFADDDYVTIFDDFHAFLQEELNGSIVTNYVDVATALTEFTEGALTGSQVTLPSIAVAAGERAKFSLTFKVYDDSPNEWIILSSGEYGEGDSLIDRTVQLNYTLDEDTALLDYAIFSRSRVIINGDTTIDGDAFSSWEGVGFGAPFELDADSTVNGTLSVLVDESDWDGSEVDPDSSEGILYNQPDIDGYTVDDFDISAYAAAASGNISPSDKSGSVNEYFPHAPGDYTSPAAGTNNKVKRFIYENLNYTDVSISSGNGVLFRNVTFNGVLFIGSANGGGNSSHTNVRFENCTFNGPVVTQISNNMTQEDWKKNLLYFTEDSTFNNSSSFQDVTVLAPNFNVNIGNTQTVSSSQTNTIDGLIVGGVVDIRGNVDVEGTIMSIGEPSEDSEGGEFATNAGFSDENNESNPNPNLDGTINVSANPDGSLPIGVRINLEMTRDPDSYVEHY